MHPRFQEAVTAIDINPGYPRSHEKSAKDTHQDFPRSHEKSAKDTHQDFPQSHEKSTKDTHQGFPRSRGKCPKDKGGTQSNTNTPNKITTSNFTPSPKPDIPATNRTPTDDVSQVYAALTLGTRDYIHKTGFQKVAIALSGGIDSSIVACIAADAIGPENIVGVAMPSRLLLRRKPQSTHKTSPTA